MKKIKLVVTSVLCMFFLSSYAQSQILHYKNTFIPLYNENSELRIAIRKFTKDENPYFLVVDPYSLTTAVVEAATMYARHPLSDTEEVPGYFEWGEISATPYVSTLLKTTTYNGMLQNGGLTRALHPIDGYFLSVDMCPSIKNFETDFFQKLTTIDGENGNGFPVAIAMTGLWMVAHQDELQWLLTMSEQDKLNITWVNHSYSHLYFSDLPLNANFLLFIMTNTEDELLSTERMLLELDQIPSVFIRFPGLVADEKLMIEARNYGLIPLGSDAWLGKGEAPEDGSIILVHGNSNEPHGIEAVMPYLEDDAVVWRPIIEAVVSP